MFQKIDFTKAGGFPLTQNTMNFIQNSYNSVLEALSRAVGDYVIISGVTDLGGNVYSDGWVTYNGKIIPFEGGSLGNVSIVTVTSDETYRDSSVYTVNYEYKAVFGASGIPFTTFKRLSLDQLNTEIQNVENIAVSAVTIANNAVSGTIPVGAIMMWAGTTAPSGWAICDGTNGTPNLSSRFIVGYNAGNPDYDAIGKTGGATHITLGTTQMPSHSHTINSAGSHTHTLPTGPFAVWISNEADAGSGSSGNEVAGTGQPNTNSSGSHTHTMSSEGGGQPHENRPPFYTLAYIIKL